MNRGGSITEEVILILSYQGHKECAVFEVCDLGKSNLIIGYTWLHKHNPEINWETGKVEMCYIPHKTPRNSTGNNTSDPLGHSD